MDINPILQNIYEQPEELVRVLDDLTGPKLEQVLDICRVVHLSGEVVLTSMGSALYSLMPMYEAMLEAGMRNVRLIETAELIHNPERLSRNALYFMMSRSGESREVADFSRWVHEHNYTSVCVTMTPDSTMAVNCTYALHDIASYDKIVCIKAYSSMALCGLFIVSMMDRDVPDRALVNSLKGAFSWMEENKESLLQAIEGIGFLPQADSFYLISRGWGLNMMRSTSLWLEETAKVPANVMSVDNFYHGPMELIRAQGIAKSKTVPILLDALPDSRSKMIWGYVNDATQDTVYFGTNPDARAANRFIFPDLGLPAHWMMLVQAMYFQLLSYQTAIANGIEPGMFFEDGWVVK
ncbi:MAG: hypothetical protein LIV25_05665 [Olsenella sp.]|nr:hypothetical protein [Olsenella sp.]